MIIPDPADTRTDPRRREFGDVNKMAREYLSPAEVADRIGLSPRTLANWRCARPPLGPRYQRFGNRIAYPKAEFDAWAAANLFSSTADYPKKANPPPGLPDLSDAELAETIEDLISRVAQAHAERERRQRAANAPAESSMRKSRRGAKAPRRRRK